MNIHAKQGDKVVFTCNGGYDGEIVQAKQIFIIGNVYEVEHVSVGGFSSSVKIVDIEGNYNTCLFDDFVETSIPAHPVKDQIEKLDAAYKAVIDFLDEKAKPDQDQMTLRDQFAMAALNALIAKEYKDDVKRGAKGVPIFAQYAYEYADAMLEARKK